MATLRALLEADRFESDKRMRESLSSAEDRIAQLQSTIGALREDLERTHFAREDATNAIRTQYRSEVALLQATVQALRERLEEATTGTGG